MLSTAGTPTIIMQQKGGTREVVVRTDLSRTTTTKRRKKRVFSDHHKFFVQLVLIKEKGAELDRVEALQVLREILRTLQEQTAITSVSLDETPPSGNCSIKIRSSFNECSRGQIHSVLDKHHLAMEENMDSIVVYSP